MAGGWRRPMANCNACGKSAAGNAATAGRGGDRTGDRIACTGGLRAGEVDAGAQLDWSLDEAKILAEKVKENLLEFL